jgi:hypothetical protein
MSASPRNSRNFGPTGIMGKSGENQKFEFAMRRSGVRSPSAPPTPKGQANRAVLSRSASLPALRRQRSQVRILSGAPKFGPSVNGPTTLLAALSVHQVQRWFPRSNRNFSNRDWDSKNTCEGRSKPAFRPVTTRSGPLRWLYEAEIAIRNGLNYRTFSNFRPRRTKHTGVTER